MSDQHWQKADRPRAASARPKLIQYFRECNLAHARRLRPASTACCPARRLPAAQPPHNRLAVAGRRRHAVEERTVPVCPILPAPSRVCRRGRGRRGVLGCGTSPSRDAERAYHNEHGVDGLLDPDEADEFALGLRRGRADRLLGGLAGPRNHTTTPWPRPPPRCYPEHVAGPARGSELAGPHGPFVLQRPFRCGSGPSP